MENFETVSAPETLEQLQAEQEVLMAKITELAQNVGQYGEGNFGEELVSAIEAQSELVKKIIEAGVQKGKQGNLPLE
jgi:hypothetical protein